MNLEEEIYEMRKQIINIIATENPNIAELVLTEGYLVTSVGVSNGVKQETYFIVDFTSKQDEHLHDLENYTIQMYNKFNGNSVC